MSFTPRLTRALAALALVGIATLGITTGVRAVTARHAAEARALAQCRALLAPSAAGFLADDCLALRLVEDK